MSPLCFHWLTRSDSHAHFLQEIKTTKNKELTICFHLQLEMSSFPLKCVKSNTTTHFEIVSQWSIENERKKNEEFLQHHVLFVGAGDDNLQANESIVMSEWSNFFCFPIRKTKIWKKTKQLFAILHWRLRTYKYKRKISSVVSSNSMMYFSLWSFLFVNSLLVFIGNLIE